MVFVRGSWNRLPTVNEAGGFRSMASVSLAPGRLVVFSCVLVALAACDRTGQVSDTTRLLAESSPAVPAWTYLTYTHAGQADTLWAGAVGGIVEDATEVWLDVGGRTDEASLREHLRVEPGSALDGEVRWSEYQEKAMFRLHRLLPGREVFVTLRAGLPREGADPLPDDQVWRLRREEGAAVAIAADGPGVLLFDGGRYVSASTGVPGTEPVLFVPADTVRLELRFTRVMDAAGVESRIRAELERARSLEFAWEEADHLIVTLVFPPPEGTTAPGWDSHYLDLRGLLDVRGLPNVDPRLLTFEVGRAQAFHRWSPAGDPEVVGEAPPRLLFVSHRRVVGEAGLLAWHFEEVIGDYWGVAPWLVRPEEGDYLRIGDSLAAFEALSLEWFPSGDRVAVAELGAVKLVERDGSRVNRIALEDSAHVLQFAVHPEDGRLAVVTLPQLADAEDITASLVVFSPEGQVTGQVAEITRMAFPESSPESLWLHWLADGRLAFLHRPRGAWGVDDETSRTVAIIELERAEVIVTETPAAAIRDAGTDGRLLLDGNRMFDPDSGDLETIGVRTRGVELLAISPDGESVAGINELTGEIGVFGWSDRRWRVLGEGSLIGWSRDGALYWLGPAERR